MTALRDCKPSQHLLVTAAILNADVHCLSFHTTEYKFKADSLFLPSTQPYLFHRELFEDRIIFVQAQFPEPV